VRPAPPNEFETPDLWHTNQYFYNKVSIRV